MVIQKWEKSKKALLAYESSRTKKQKKERREEAEATWKEKKKEPKKPVAQPRTIREPAPIRLEPKPKEKTGLAKLREQDTITGELIKASTDWRTTVALVGTLATLGIGSAIIAGIGTKAVAGTIGTGVTVGIPKALEKIGTKINVDAIGKAAGLTARQTSALATQIGRERINVLARYAVNPKSTALTTKLLSKLGLTIGATGILLGAINSYPFAGFLKEEALQTIGFGFFTAEKNNDIEGMEMAIEETDEILNSAPSILSKIPYANVLKELAGFFEAVAVKLEIDKRTLEKKRQIETGEVESEFAKERRLTDEAAQERKREFAEEESQRYEDIQTENLKRDVDLANLWNNYYAAIRNKNWAERDKILKEIENYGK